MEVNKKFFGYLKCIAEWEQFVAICPVSDEVTEYLQATGQELHVPLHDELFGGAAVSVQESEFSPSFNTANVEEVIEERIQTASIQWTNDPAFEPTDGECCPTCRRKWSKKKKTIAQPPAKKPRQRVSQVQGKPLRRESTDGRPPAQAGSKVKIS